LPLLSTPTWCITKPFRKSSREAKPFSIGENSNRAGLTKKSKTFFQPPQRASGTLFSQCTPYRLLSAGLQDRNSLYNKITVESIYTTVYFKT
jgi:hypothetical protein